MRDSGEFMLGVRGKKKEKDNHRLNVSTGLVHQLTGSSDGSSSRGRAESVEDERWSLILHMWRLFPPLFFFFKESQLEPFFGL